MRGIIPIVFFLFTQTVFAQVTISEIKYTGNEWVELLNEGSEVDLSSWKFVEGGVGHKLKAIQGEAMIAQGTYAIIANDATRFLSEYPHFHGTLFDSSFSLLDAGEEISIKAPDGSVVDIVSYVGTKGSKNSLQKSGGEWSEGLPTPSDTASVSFVQSKVESLATDSPIQATSTISSRALAPVEIEATDRTAIVGVPLPFESQVLNPKGEPLAESKISWAFGDGGTALGMTVSHTYHYPGEYIAVLEVASGDYQGAARIRVHVVAPLLSLRTGGDAQHSFLAVENRGGDELDLGGWQIIAGSEQFVVPLHTILGAHQTITFASEVTGLAVSSVTPILFAPSGTKMATGEPTPSSAKVVEQTKKVKIKPRSSVDDLVQVPLAQRASLAEAVKSSPLRSTMNKAHEQEDRLWVWYVGVAILAIGALLGLRFARMKSSLVDEFDIIDESDDKKDDIF